MPDPEGLRLKIEFDLATGAVPLAGVDEAGRGPLAGPVVAAAVVMRPGPPIDGIDDSKKLSAARRQELLVRILDGAESVGLGVVDADRIDGTNILAAARMAMGFALCGLAVRPTLVLVDGLHAPLDVPGLEKGYEVRTVVHGDSKSYCVAAASIVAKCVRDAIMREYHMRYPEYGFQKHKGYGTAEHLEALSRHGPCPIHRMSFAPLRSGYREAENRHE